MTFLLGTKLSLILDYNTKVKQNLLHFQFGVKRNQKLFAFTGGRTRLRYYVILLTD